MSKPELMILSSTNVNLKDLVDHFDDIPKLMTQMNATVATPSKFKCKFIVFIILLFLT